MGAVETCHRRCQTNLRGASGVETCICRRHRWASARVRDAVRGSAVSTWPRRRKREATTKRQAHAGRQGKGLTMQIKFESCLGLGRAGSKGSKGER
jgi:hypothetical protein